MDRFGPATQRWFESSFPGSTEVQERGWARIAAGEHALLCAPTGSGKTLAAFLYYVDRLAHEPPAEPGVRVLYVSPLKALVYDIERNLRAPLAGIARAAEEVGEAVRLPRVAVRTGDTTPRERRAQLREPGEILVTTPESLYLLLTSQARETLRTIDTIIIDEVHALAPTKRGAHLALSLERLCAITAREPQRIGLSATARPTAEVARFLGGDRPVSVVDTTAPPRLDLRIVVPVADMTRPEDDLPAPPEDIRPGEKGIWPAIHPRLIELVRGHRSTLVFVNSRGLCERLTHRLNDLAGEELVRSHHGSLSHAERRRVEQALASGALRAIVATSSLELGIDMGAIDLVVLVESPGSVARGLQRVGRAGHAVGEVSVGRVFPKHRGDLLEAAVVSERMRAGDIEPLVVPENPLDVLAQQVVAAVAMDEQTVDAVGGWVRRAAPFHELPDSALRGVLDMLAGRYPSSALAELRPRLVWDRESGRLTPRRGARLISIVSGGTIPDRGTYAVYLGEDGPRVGELDEEMVHETTPGQTFTLGATTWRVEGVTRDRVLVSPAPGEPGKLPFWRGDGPGRPIELGRALGALVREVGELPPARAAATLEQRHGLDPLAARNLIAYVTEQRAHTGTLPTDRAITVERFRDELGDWRVCILSPLGARVHAPWALAVQNQLSRGAGIDVQTLWSDDGIVVRFDAAAEPPPASALVPDADDVWDLVVEELGGSALFAGQFRENAARALLLPRRRPGERTPLWMQRLKSSQLLGVAREFPDFPIIMETYRACLRDVFDMPALVELLGAVRRREIAVEPVETPNASPFARSLVFAYVGANLYEGDAPLAERRAQALSLDRQMLRELLGADELRELLDADVITELERELQHLADDRRARDADELHDALRRVGDLATGEATARADGDAAAWLAALEHSGRAARMTIGGADRWIAAEDAGLYRDALGVAPPAVADAFLEPRTDAVAELLGRFARTRGPFVAGDAATRFALPPAQARALLAPLIDSGRIVSGGFRPGGAGEELCDADVLRRIKRRTLARLRHQVAPVAPAALGAFLPAWHGIGEARRGPARLEEVLAQLEGLPLPWSELESAILPARVADFHPRMLDELGAMGRLVWVGCGALGKKDGRVALYRRERVAALLEPADPPDDLGDTARAFLDHLAQRGASFTVALAEARPGAPMHELEQALWQLAWAGLVTNDTFQPLRTAPRPAGAKPRRRGAAVASGRWSLVRELAAGAPSPTERAHARAVTLLDRHGVVCRESVAIEDAPGGFSALYPVLRAMEEAGKVRRGYFVDSLGGAQFAMPGAVDRLRDANAHRDRGPVTALSAIDPANPYGWLVPWPDTGEAAPPRRVAGAAVVLVGGAPALYLDRGAHRALTFGADAETLTAAAGALPALARRRRGRYLRLDTIDGAPARAAPCAAAFLAAGFYPDHRGLTLELAC